MIRQPTVAPHSLPEPATAQLDLPLRTSGVMIGQESRQPLVVRLFRPKQTQVGVFASTYVARVLAHRALAVGAQIVVVTARPAIWTPLVRSAPSGPWVTVVPPNSSIPAGGSALRPPLIVDDVGVGGATRRELGPWQTGVTLRPYLAEQAVGTLHAFDMVVLQRTSPESVPIIRQAFGIPADSAQWLPRMPDDTVALVERGQVRFVGLAVTQVEQMAFGKPTRQDT